MGIAPYKYFTYDGESSRNYDVYLTGDGVFNAPERDVEMVEIPGRNGNYALDHGKFKNISVTYKAGIVDVSESNFADKMSAVRNWLCSKVGYKRLSDDYNPNEYRMAVYKSGVTVEHIDLKTGEFEITFECKPQRWLTSGETKLSVSSGATLANPTLFPAGSLLEFNGYGTINIGSYTIEVEYIPIGEVQLYGGTNGWGKNNNAIVFNGGLLNTSDTFTASCVFRIQYYNKTNYNITSFVVDSATNCQTTNTRKELQIIFGDYTFAKGTTSSHSCSVTYTVTVYGSQTHTSTSTQRTVTGTIDYDGDETITFNLAGAYAVSNTSSSATINIAKITGDSTVSSAGNPAYIDLDIGEAWNEDSGEPTSINDAVSMGADIPKVMPGNNYITYDNTISSFKITPRWWKV